MMENTWSNNWLSFNKDDGETWPKESKEYLVCYGRKCQLLIAMFSQNQWQSRPTEQAVLNLNDTVTHWCSLPPLPETVQLNKT